MSIQTVAGMGLVLGDLLELERSGGIRLGITDTSVSRSWTERVDQ